MLDDNQGRNGQYLTLTDNMVERRNKKMERELKKQQREEEQRLNAEAKRSKKEAAKAEKEPTREQSKKCLTGTKHSSPRDPQSLHMSKKVQ